MTMNLPFFFYICFLSIAMVSAWTIRIDDSTPITGTGGSMPPMVSVPIENASGGIIPLPPPPLREIIKPPNVEDLYDWYTDVRGTPDADPSWAVLWPTAMGLAAHLSSHPGLIAGKKVVELGCGLGLCGVACSALGASSVVLTDREPYAMQCALSTADANGLLDDSDNRLIASLMDWNDGEAEILRATGGTADVVLASDVLYDLDGVKGFAFACLCIIGQRRGSGGSDGDHEDRYERRVILISDPKIERVRGARAAFLETLREFGVDAKIEITDLPQISCRDEEYVTMDGKDHANRMAEETVLIKCTF